MIGRINNNELVFDNYILELERLAYDLYNIKYNGIIIGTYSKKSHHKYYLHKGSFKLNDVVFAFSTARLDNIVIRIASNRPNRYTMNNLKSMQRQAKDKSAQFNQNVYDEGLHHIDND